MFIEKYFHQYDLELKAANRCYLDKNLNNYPQMDNLILK